MEYLENALTGKYDFFANIRVLLEMNTDIPEIEYLLNIFDLYKNTFYDDKKIQNLQSSDTTYYRRILIDISKNINKLIELVVNMATVNMQLKYAILSHIIMPYYSEMFNDININDININVEPIKDEAIKDKAIKDEGIKDK